MAEVGSIVVNARMQHAEFTRGSKKIREEMARIQEQINSGQRSLRAFYQTQARRADRGALEQNVRDEMAARIKAMRAAVFQDKVQAEVQNRLFGGPVMIQQAEQAGRAAGDATKRGYLDELKSIYGMEGKIGKVVSLVLGGGAIAGVSLAANRMAEGFDRIRHALDDVDRGAKTTGEAMKEAVRAVPIMGNFAMSLIELIFRRAMQIKQIVRDIESDGYRFAKELDDRASALGDEAKSGADRLALAQTTGVARELLEIEQKRTAERERYQKLADEAAKLPAGMAAQATVDAVSGQMAADLEADEARASVLERERANTFRAVEERMRQRRQDELASLRASFDAAERIREAIKTPVERLKEELDRAETLYGRGLLTAEEAEKARQQIADRLPDPPREPERALVGRERRFSFRSPTSMPQSDPLLDQARRQAEKLDQIRAGTDRLKELGEVPVFTLDE